MSQSKDYSGWKLFDNLIIVGKDPIKGTIKQGFIVDPKNKSQLHTAMAWATYTSHNNWDPEKHEYTECIQHKPTVHEYVNTGFKLCLAEAAGGSSQGGKLSFWNCDIEAPDGEHFLVGISSNLLLDLLKENTCECGRVKNNVFFARKNGEVGVLTTNMESYKTALNDKQLVRDAKSARKTKKYKLGYTYSTLTICDVYLGAVWQHYEYHFAPHSYVTKLKTPVKRTIFKTYDKEKTNASDYVVYSYDILATNPARIESSSQLVTIDTTVDEFLDDLKQRTPPSWTDAVVLAGYSSSPDIVPTEESVLAAIRAYNAERKPWSMNYPISERIFMDKIH